MKNGVAPNAWRIRTIFCLGFLSFVIAQMQNVRRIKDKLGIKENPLWLNVFQSVHIFTRHELSCARTFLLFPVRGCKVRNMSQSQPFIQSPFMVGWAIVQALLPYGLCPALSWIFVVINAKILYDLVYIPLQLALFVNLYFLFYLSQHGPQSPVLHMF